MPTPLIHTLEDRSALTATATGNSHEFPRMPGVMNVELDVTAVATAAGDTLDVVIQTEIGGNWVDVIAFTQVTGNGGTKRHFAKIVANEPQAMFENATSLSAGSIRHLVGFKYRAVMTIASASSPSFDFTIKLVGE